MKSNMNIKSIFIMAIISIASLLFINISFAANTGVINVEVANLRETANSESKILEQISLNQEVEILSEEGDWYKVIYKNITGYVNKELVTVNANTEKTNENLIETTNEISSNNIEEKITTNEQVKIEKGKEYKISENTKLKLIPSINATDVIELKKDEKVIVTEIINGWVSIETQTIKGWLRKDKLIKENQEVEQTVQIETSQEPNQQEQNQQETIQTQAQPIKTQYINSASVNVRKEANVSSEIIKTVSLNTEVQVFNEENGWSKVKIDTIEGFISSSLLSNTKIQTSRGQTTSRKSSSTINNNSSTAQSANEKTTKLTEETPKVPSSSKGSAIVETAKAYLGYKYVYGGNSPSTGFDCSGFTSYIFRQCGVSLNRTAAGQYSNGVYVSRANLQPGDLVMFGKSSITHVGIYIGGGQIIHAATASKGVRIDSLSTGYYNSNYIGARRIL